MPRILPLVGIAVGGVLAINAIAGARDLPGLISGAKAFAEEAAKPIGGDKPKAKKPKAAATSSEATTPDAAAPGAAATAATGDAKDAAANTALPPPTITPKAVCAPTAAELAKEAGLSPGELQVLQNLGARRDQLDHQAEDLSTQLALLAAAESKLDAKTKVLNGLKTDIQGLLAQADGREASEVDRLVKVYEGMKAPAAAARLAILDDSVRLPIAAKMKERALSAIVGQMSPADAKKLTESLAHRFAAAQTLAQNANTQADAAATATNVTGDPTKPPGKAKSTRTAKKTPPRKKAPADAEASDAPADKPAPVPAAAPPPAKAG